MSSWSPPPVPPPRTAHYRRWTRARRVLIGLAAAVLLPATAVGLYLGAWWLRGDTVDRDVRVQNRNTGAQTAWADEARDKVEDFQLLDEGQPAKASLRRSACELIGRLSDPYVDDQLATFQAEDCQ